MSDMTAIYVIKEHQKQLDPEGVEVGVSRQALDMVIAEYEAADAEITRLKEELGRYKAALLEAMEWNWLDEDAPPRFDVDNPPELDDNK